MTEGVEGRGREGRVCGIPCSGMSSVNLNLFSISSLLMLHTDDIMYVVVLLGHICAMHKMRPVATCGTMY